MRHGVNPMVHTIQCDIIAQSRRTVASWLDLCDILAYNTGMSMRQGGAMKVDWLSMRKDVSLQCDKLSHTTCDTMAH